jgi:hypothetical protein
MEVLSARLVHAATAKVLSPLVFFELNVRGARLPIDLYKVVGGVFHIIKILNIVRCHVMDSLKCYQQTQHVVFSMRNGG